MSDRPLAERHEFTGAAGHELAVAFDPQCPDYPDVFGEYGEQDLTLELLRVVHERDRLMVIMAGALKSFAILGLGPGASGEDFTEAAQRAVEQRDALGKALRELRFQAARSIAGSGPRTAERRLAEFVQERALGALRSAGLPEEGS